MQQNTIPPIKKIKHQRPVYERFMLWIGSPASLLGHSIFFVGIFILELFGVSTNEVLLILTTAVSLEAIYMAIFIQMAVNKTNISLKDVEEDVAEIQEDVEEIQEDVGEIHENVGELQEDVEEIQKDFDDVQEDVEVLEGHVHEIKEDMEEVSEGVSPAKPSTNQMQTIELVQKQLQVILNEIEKLKKK